MHKIGRTILIALAASGLLGLVVLAAYRIGGSHGAPAGRLETAAAAVERAFAYLGLERKRIQVSTERVTLLETTDRTPFLRARLIGRPVWCVKLANVQLRWEKDGKEWENPHIHNLYVFLDPGDGQLLKISSRAPDGSSSTEPICFGGAGREYTGFPATAPQVCFRDALAHADFADPASARQLVAHYVMRPGSRIRDPAGTPRAMWVIYLRGFAPIPLPGPSGSSGNELGESVNRVDAETGEWLGGGSCDWPE